MAEIDLDDLSTPNHGYTVDDRDDDDPVLLDRNGNHIDTWRERYPCEFGRILGVQRACTWFVDGGHSLLGCGLVTGLSLRQRGADDSRRQPGWYHD